MNAQTARDLMPHNFNSIKVRLELDSRIKMQDAMSFQFHKGAIRTFSLIH